MQAADRFSEFKDFCTRHAFVSGKWTGAPPRSQVIEVLAYGKDSGIVPLDLLVYVRTDFSYDWWGITYAVRDKLVASGRKWCLVLLEDTEEGYLLTGAQVSQMKSVLSKGGTQYHVKVKNAATGVRFKSFEQLYRALISL